MQQAPTRAPVAQDRGATPTDFYYDAQGNLIVNGVNQGQPSLAMPVFGNTGQSQGFARGGAINQGLGYLRSSHDGMADKIAATIDGTQPAKLSGGEFVIPADVVSHLGNGNSDAGAKQLHEFLSRVRKARTGSTKQGRQINPSKFMPK
jgi:hypothetical protein